MVLLIWEPLEGRGAPPKREQDMKLNHYEEITIPNKKFGELEIAFEIYTIDDRKFFEMSPKHNDLGNDRYSKLFDSESEFNAYLKRYRAKAI